MDDRLHHIKSNYAIKYIVDGIPKIALIEACDDETAMCHLLALRATGKLEGEIKMSIDGDKKLLARLFFVEGFSDE